MTAAFIDRTINGNHTFACALTTRGGVCDCWPEQAAVAPAGSTAPEADSVEHCALCGRRGGFAHVLVDLDGIDQLCESCALHAEDGELVDAAQVIDL
jgi:hypothetical protein